MKFVEKLPKWLRWILCPISSVLALFIVSVLTRLFIWFQSNMLGMGEGAWFDEIWKNLIAPGITGFATIYVGVYVAPSHKKIVSLVLGALFVMLGGISLLGMLGDRNWWGLLNVIFTIGGLGAGIYFTFEEEEKLKNID